MQRARRRGYMAVAAVYESLLSRMEVMAGVSSSIASVSAAGTALLPTTARPAKFVPMQEAVIRLCSSLLECLWMMSFVGASAGLSCSDCIADTLLGMASNGMYLVPIGM